MYTLTLQEKCLNWVDGLSSNVKLQRAQAVLGFVLSKIGEWGSAGIVGIMINDYYLQKSKLTLQLFLGHWQLLITLLLSFIGWMLQRAAKTDELDTEKSYDALESLYDDLDLGSIKDADIRIALWIPVKNEADGNVIQLKQYTDYVPRQSQISLPGSNQRAIYKNGKAGRKYIVARNEGNLKRPIGIMGVVVTDSLNKKEVTVRKEILPEGQDFVRHMIEEHCFERRIAVQLRQDRKVFMAVALESTPDKKLLGVVYLDSKIDFLSPELSKKLTDYLPKIAKTLVLKKA